MYENYFTMNLHFKNYYFMLKISLVLNVFVLAIIGAASWAQMKSNSP